MPVRKTTDFCLRLLASLIKAVSINRVWIEENKVCKCRRWWARPLILVGNPVLACRQVPVRVLFTKQWIRWERKIKRALDGQNVPAGSVLVCNQVPGVPLADWLRESDESKKGRIEVLKVAVDALKVFHRVEIDHDDGDKILLSHGDATLNNILYDSHSGSMQWIDFDLRHWLNVPAAQRHADDLRAFLFSTARHLSEPEIPGFLAFMQQQYDDPKVWSCLQSQLSSYWFRWDVFHQAQIQRGRSSNDSKQVDKQKLTLLESLICA